MTAGRASTPESAQISHVQERVYDETYNYRGDPHLAHPELHARLLRLIVEAAHRAVDRGLPPRVLEIGAGDGGITESMLARGFEVTATEISRDAVDRLRRAFGANPRFEVVLDPTADASGVKGGPFTVVLCASVLHHIPDYLGFVEQLIRGQLAPDGTFVSIQDPLRYDTMSPVAHRVDRGAYLVWRLGRGSRLAGLVSMFHRLTGRMDPARAGDVVEYHVVRNGVDERALEERLQPRFRRLRLVPYWSNQSRIAQRLGGRLGLVNQFAIVAEGHGRHATAASSP